MSGRLADLPLLLALWFVACGDNPDSGEPCAKVPAFRLRLSVAGGALPQDTMLRVRAQFGEEQYRVYDPEPTDVLRCQPTSAAAEIATLECNVWTQSAATYEVTAAGYRSVSGELSIDRDDDDCIVPLEAMVKLVVDE